jgi:hypothetical protein
LGFTHYLENQPKEHEQNRWNMFVEAVKHVASELPETTDTAGGYHKDNPLVLGDWEGEGGEPIFNENGIRFNGVGDLSHESFTLRRIPMPDIRKFDFCKTARKPYDLMVCSTLLLYWHFFKEEGVKISSDGDHSDWEPAIDLVKEVTGLHIDWMENIDTIVEQTTIELPVYGIVLTLDADGNGGTISDDIHEEDEDEDAEMYNCAIDGITSMILAHACAGVDIMSPSYLEGIETAVEAVSNQFA